METTSQPDRSDNDLGKPIQEFDIQDIKTKLVTAESPLGPDGQDQNEQETRVQRVLDELESIKKDDLARETFRTQQRIRSIESWPDLQDKATMFLMEISGIQPYREIRKPFSFVEVTMEVMKSQDAQQVIQQMQRDQVQGRSVFGQQDTLAPFYRMAASIRSVQFYDPQTGNAIKSEDIGTELTDEQEKQLGDTVDRSAVDLPVRSKYLFLREKLFASSVLLEGVMNEFIEFESQVFDLQFLLRNKPDFFQQGSAAAS